MSLRVTFANSITFTLIKEYGEGPGVDIESVLRPVYHVAWGEFVSNETF